MQMRKLVIILLTFVFIQERERDNLIGCFFFVAFHALMICHENNKGGEVESQDESIH
jgi:hypothetical protein